MFDFFDDFSEYSEYRSEYSEFRKEILDRIDPKGVIREALVFAESQIKQSEEVDAGANCADQIGNLVIRNQNYQAMLGELGIAYSNAFEAVGDLLSLFEAVKRTRIRAAEGVISMLSASQEIASAPEITSEDIP